MEDVAEGKISSNEGSTQLEELRQKGDELQKRIQYLRKEENSEEALRAAEEKHQERKRKATLGYISAKNKLIQSGNVTQDLQQALEKIK